MADKKKTIRPLSRHHVDALKKGKHFDQMFPKKGRKHLEYTDLRAREHNVTIEELISVRAYSPEYKKITQQPALKFVGKSKYLIIRPVTRKQISKTLGTDDTEVWTGKRIKLYACEVLVTGHWTPVIRIKKASPLRKRKRDAKK